MLWAQASKERLMNPYRFGLIALAASATLLASIASAQTQQLSFGKISIVNSGPDLDEVERVRRMSPSYPLRVVFSGRGGDFYVADRLTFKQGGHVLADVPDAGPWLMVALPPGAYELEASFGDRTLRRGVNVGRIGTTLHWAVPSSID
jgi:hypothetical protein